MRVRIGTALKHSSTDNHQYFYVVLGRVEYKLIPKTSTILHFVEGGPSEHVEL